MESPSPFGNSGRHTLIAWVCGIALAACHNSGGDARCNSANCKAMLSCGPTLYYGVSRSDCYTKVSGAQSLTSNQLIDAEIPYCIDSCNDGNDGSLVQCYGSLAPSCPMPVPGDAIDTCAARVDDVDAGPSTQAQIDCSTGCGDTWSACDSACPIDTLDACFSCAESCAITAHHCADRCYGFP